MEFREENEREMSEIVSPPARLPPQIGDETDDQLGINFGPADVINIEFEEDIGNMQNVLLQNQYEVQEDRNLIRRVNLGGISEPTSPLFSPAHESPPSTPREYPPIHFGNDGSGGGGIRTVTQKIVFSANQSYQLFLQLMIFEYLKECIPIPIYMLMIFKKFEMERLARKINPRTQLQAGTPANQMARPPPPNDHVGKIVEKEEDEEEVEGEED